MQIANMTTEEMTHTIMNIHSNIMFSRKKENYSELLMAVEELRYSLLYELDTIPTKERMICEGTFEF